MADDEQRRRALESLELDASATQDEVVDAIERLTRRAATLSTVSPERSIQLREQIRRARSALLSPAGAERLDVAAPSPSTPPEPQKATVPPRPAPTPAPAPVPAATRCLACDAPCRPEDRFCTACGTPRASASTTHACTGCGAPVGETDRFCISCGTAVPERPAPRPTEPSCASCGRPSSPLDRFCTACGAPQSRPSACSRCGAAMRDADRFCTSCGTPATTA